MTNRPLLLIDVDRRPQCSTDGCMKPAQAMGLCSMHYRRWHLYGDPHFVKVIRGDSERAFWSHVTKGADDECWLWNAALLRSGYGKFQAGGRTWRAHVWAYTHFVGSIPEGMQLDHVKTAGCTRLNCVNYLRHLEPVTAKENVLRSGGPAAINSRKTHCKRGHEFTPENTYWQGPDRKHRECLACKKADARARYLAKKGSK